MATEVLQAPTGVENPHREIIEPPPHPWVARPVLRLSGRELKEIDDKLTIAQLKVQIEIDEHIPRDHFFLQCRGRLLADNEVVNSLGSFAVIDVVFGLPQRGARKDYAPPGLSSTWAAGWEELGEDTSKMSGDEWIDRQLKQLESREQEVLKSGNEHEAAILGYRLSILRAAKVRRQRIQEVAMGKSALEERIEAVERHLKEAIEDGRELDAGNLGYRLYRMKAKLLKRQQQTSM
jgi:hypothetical protein